MASQGTAPMRSRRKTNGWVLVVAICACTLVCSPFDKAFATPSTGGNLQLRSVDFTGRRTAARPGRSSPAGLAAEAEAKAAAIPAIPEAQEEKPYSLRIQALLFLCYFSLQSGMSFYMKWLLSKVKIASDLVGVPASFLVTTSQQLVGFSLFLVFILGSYLIGRPYKPKALKNTTEVLLVLALSLSFTLNIGLNLLSLSLVPLSLTMIIRGCSPLSTALTSTLIGKKSDISAGEWGCMMFGVMCASAVVMAQSGGLSGNASFAFFFGVAISVSSLFSASLDFVFKGILGANVKLNALDTICYMALPVAVFTSFFGAIVCKPVPPTWAAMFTPRMTDFTVFQKLWEINPLAFKWVMLSGGVAFIYNVFVTFMVVKLSPTTTAFAGNFNKAATILLSLLVFEGNLPAGWRGAVILTAIGGNIASFAIYNVLKRRRGK